MRYHSSAGGRKKGAAHVAEKINPILQIAAGPVILNSGIGFLLLSVTN
jgi:hypothetical protein